MMRFTRVFLALFIAVLSSKPASAQSAAVGQFCPTSTFDFSRYLAGHMTGQAKDTVVVKVVCGCCPEVDGAKKKTISLAVPPKTKITPSKPLAVVPKVTSRPDTSYVKHVGGPDSMVVTMHFDTLYVVVENSFLGGPTTANARAGVGPQSSDVPERKPYAGDASWFRRNEGPIIVGTTTVVVVTAAILIAKSVHVSATSSSTSSVH